MSSVSEKIKMCHKFISVLQGFCLKDWKNTQLINPSMEKFSKSLKEMWMHLHLVSLKGISVNITCFELIFNYFADCELPSPL